MGVYDQIKSVFQDIVAPEIHALRGEMRAITTQVDSIRNEMGSLRNEMGSLRGGMGSLRNEMSSMKAELVAEIRRVDTRIDGVERELSIAIDVRERLAALEARRN